MDYVTLRLPLTLTLLAILSVAYLGYMYHKVSKVRRNMNDIADNSHRSSLLFYLRKYDNASFTFSDDVAESFLKKYVEYMCLEYAQLHAPTDTRGAQWLYNISKKHTNTDFFYITFYKYTQEYIEKHYLDLSKFDQTLRKQRKNDLCKQIDAMYLSATTALFDRKLIHDWEYSNTKKYVASKTL